MRETTRDVRLAIPRVLVCAAFLFAHSASGAAPQSPSSLPTFFGAIQVNEPDHDRWAAALLDAGLDSVQVTLYARQQAWDGATMYWDREAPWVVSEIRAAKRAGLRVVLVMRVALEHGLPENRHLWHGMIWPRSQAVNAWFDAYSEFVLWGAHIAATEDVDLFVLGNELSALTSTRQVDAIPDLYAYYADTQRTNAVNSRLATCADRVTAAGRASDLVQLDGGRYPDLRSMLTAQTTRYREWSRAVAPSVPRLNARRAAHDRAWRELIRKVRGAFRGPVTYGANFDQFADVGFWNALDAIAVTGYFPLSEYRANVDQRRATMTTRWSEIGRDTAAAAQLPLIFIELGWTRREGGTVRPYSYDRVEVLETAGTNQLSCVHWDSQPEDPHERVDAMEALADAVAGGALPYLRGFSLWKLSTNPEHRAIEPFAAILRGGRGTAPIDRADAAYLGAAARVAEVVGADSRRPPP